MSGISKDSTKVVRNSANRATPVVVTHAFPSSHLRNRVVVVSGAENSRHCIISRREVSCVDRREVDLQDAIM